MHAVDSSPNEGRPGASNAEGLTEDLTLDGDVWDAGTRPAASNAERAPNAGSVDRARWRSGPESDRGERNGYGNERGDERWKRLDDSSSRERHVTATCRDVT